jgi:hypothetical protein
MAAFVAIVVFLARFIAIMSQFEPTVQQLSKIFVSSPGSGSNVSFLWQKNYSCRAV